MKPQKKLKYILIPVFFFLLFLAGCNKNEKVSGVPTSFHKRVLFEEFSGEWCSNCVRGNKEFLDIIKSNPGDIMGVSIHSGDAFELEYPAIAPFLISEFNIDYFPFALVDRVVNESDYRVLIDQRLGIKYNAGVKLKTEIIENELLIEVAYAANSDFDNTLLTVYITEDNVPESSPGAQVGGGGNYIHQKVLRKVLTSKIGIPVELQKGKIYRITFSTNISKYKKNDLNVIAFLHYGSTRSYEVINGNQAKAGGSAGW